MNAEPEINYLEERHCTLNKEQIQRLGSGSEKCQCGYRAGEEEFPMGDGVVEQANPRTLRVCEASINSASFLPSLRC